MMSLTNVHYLTHAMYTSRTFEERSFLWLLIFGHTVTVSVSVRVASPYSITSNRFSVPHTRTHTRPTNINNCPKQMLTAVIQRDQRLPFFRPFSVSTPVIYPCHAYCCCCCCYSLRPLHFRWKKKIIGKMYKFTVLFNVAEVFVLV